MYPGTKDFLMLLCLYDLSNPFDGWAKHFFFNGIESDHLAMLRWLKCNYLFFSAIVCCSLNGSLAQNNQGCSGEKA